MKSRVQANYLRPEFDRREKKGKRGKALRRQATTFLPSSHFSYSRRNSWEGRKKENTLKKTPSTPTDLAFHFLRQFLLTTATSGKKEEKEKRI